MNLLFLHLRTAHEGFAGAQAITSDGRLGRVERITHHGRIVHVRLPEGTLVRQRVEDLRAAYPAPAAA